MGCQVELPDAGAFDQAVKPLWTCPKCGHQFVTANLWHSCGRYELEAHFIGRDPNVRHTFDRLVELAQACGPVTIYPQKTRIVFMVRVRFGGVTTARRWLNLALWLTRRVEHPRLRKVEVYGPTTYGHQFRLANPEEIDGDLEALLREAYAVGRQEHLAGRRTPG